MRLFKIALPVLFIAGVAVAVARSWMDGSDRAARALAVEHARSEFAQRLALVRAAPDETRYRAEIRAALRAWFAAHTAIGNRWPEQRGELAPFIAAARPPPAMAAEVQELAGGAVAALREGRHTPLSGAFAEGVRADVLAVKKLDQNLKIDLLVWGVPEETVTETSGAEGRSTFRTTVPLVFRGLSFKFFDATGKQIAHMPGEGQPRLRVDIPEGLIADAPPGMVLGRYEPFLFPKDAREVEWSLALQIKMPSGDPHVVQVLWKSKMDPAWADDSGKVWSAPDTVKVEAEEPPEQPKSAARK